jgi:hypothetical protein
MPISAQTYKQRREQLGGSKVWISPKWKEQFEKLDTKLNELDIDPRSYVEDSILLWQEWAEDLDMLFVPVHVLCGDKAIERYRQLCLPTKQEEHYGLVQYFESGAAQMTVRKLLEGIDPERILRELKEDWYPEWWEGDKKLHKTVHDLAKLKAAEDVAQYYMVPFEFADYMHIAEQVLAGRISHD